MKQLTLIIIAFFSFYFECLSQNRTAGNYTHKTECLGVELDGSQTVKAWGNGKNRKDAIEQAKKNAVHDVLFKGVYEGKQDCEKRPLILEVNAHQKNESYFNSFFADGGEYEKFISMADKRVFSNDKEGARKSKTFGIVIRVLRSELKQKLIKDGIIKN